MNREPAWDRLLASLRTWAEVREVKGGVEVSFSGGAGARRTVEVVMTPGDWEELSEVVQIESSDSLKRRLLALEDDERFLVCDSGVELIASPSRDLPPNDFADREPADGEWVATDETGNVVSRFADEGDDDH